MSVLDSLLNPGKGEALPKAQAAKPRPAKRRSRSPALPAVQVNNRPLRDVSTDALDALLDANTPPQLFVRAGALVRIGADEHGAPEVHVVSEAALRGMLTRCADFVRVTKGKDGEDKELQELSPPLDVVRDILALGSWPFPALAGIVEAPTLRPDGSVLDRPGYDAARGPGGAGLCSNILTASPSAAPRTPPAPPRWRPCRPPSATCAWPCGAGAGEARAMRRPPAS